MSLIFHFYFSLPKYFTFFMKKNTLINNSNEKIIYKIKKLLP